MPARYQINQESCWVFPPTYPAQLGNTNLWATQGSRQGLVLAHDRSQPLESQIATTYYWPSKSTGESGGGGFIFRLSCFYLDSFAYLHLSSSFIPDHHEGTEEQDLELCICGEATKRKTRESVLNFNPPFHRNIERPASEPRLRPSFCFVSYNLNFHISKPTSYIPAWRTNCQRIRRPRQGTSKPPYPRR